jgi:hypothetical protein
MAEQQGRGVLGLLFTATIILTFIFGELSDKDPTDMVLVVAGLFGAIAFYILGLLRGER